MDFKIGSVPVTGISRYNDVQRKTVQNVPMKQETDKVDTSTSAKLFTQALRAVQEAPEVRTEKVEALRRSVQDGSYKIDSAAIADKMLSSVK